MIKSMFEGQGSFVGHEIYLYKNLSDLDKRVSLPGEFEDLAEDINADLQEIHSRVESASDEIIPTLAPISVQLQRAAITSYDLILTGRLLGSVSVLSSSHYYAEVGTNVFYATYVDEGRGPVTAKNKRCLHFFTKDGAEVFTRSVGPARARPYSSTSSDQLSSQIDSVVGGLLDGV